MTLKDIEKIPLYQTRTIAQATEDKATALYIGDCLRRYYSGDYGEIPQEDTAANNAELAAGDGHILARYNAAHQLQHDIYIESHFSNTIDGINDNNTLIMYVWER